MMFNGTSRHFVYGFAKDFIAFYRPIPFEDVLTILVSIFLHLDDERKGRESVRLT